MTRKKIGLALSGGAARGFAHLGVMKVFAEHNIPIDYVAGTSAGSFAGAANTSGNGNSFFGYRSGDSNSTGAANSSSFGKESNSATAAL